MNKKTAAWLTLAFSGLPVMAGCGVVQQTSALPADSFVANQPVIGSSAGQGTDHSGPLVYDERKRPTVEATEGTRISPTVADAIKGPPDLAVGAANGSDFPPPRNPTTAPASTQGRTGLTSGQYQTVGAVVAVVNSETIYADQVLAGVERALKAEALSSADEAHFRRSAEIIVGNQIEQSVRDDMEFAAAQKALEKKDEENATAYTAKWRKDQITRAGGSEAMARQRAAEDGQNFEDIVRQKYRATILEIYYSKNIFPQIQISAQDMRQYYLNNISQFQKIAAAKYRVIWIGADQTGGRDPALDKARDIVNRARHGEDFAKLAGMYNDDPDLHKNNGKVGDAEGWMPKDAYVQRKVEEEVWKLHPTEISDPIPEKKDGKDGFWVAKLEEIRPGDTKPFENEEVQDIIGKKLRTDQFNRLHEAYLIKLMHEGVRVDKEDGRIAIMEMVMQKYHFWTGK